MNEFDTIQILREPEMLSFYNYIYGLSEYSQQRECFVQKSVGFFFKWESYVFILFLS